MPSLLGTTVTANYNRVVGPEYTASGDVRTYTAPFSNFGTRFLKFYKVAGVHNAAAVNFTKKTLAGAGDWHDSGSVYALAILALQQFGEVFYTSPGTAGFVVALADNTANGAEPNSNDQATTFGAMEAAIKAAIAADTSVTVTEITVQADGLSIA